MIRIRRELSSWIAHKRSQDGIEEQLETYQLRCVTLRNELLRKDDVIRALRAEVHASRSFIPPHLLADFVLNEIPRKRAAAVERNRREYEHCEAVACCHNTEGHDEIDAKLARSFSTPL